MNISKKNIVNLIKKMADNMWGDPAPGPAVVPAPAPHIPIFDPPKVNPVKTNNTLGNSKIQEMQRAIQDLAFEVTRDSTSKTLGPKPQFVNKQEGEAPLVAAKKGFNDFIAEQYLGTLDEDKRGVEWTPDKSVTNINKKKETQTDPYELNVVMNTMQRIGAGSKEFQADGSWGPRTDNALRNTLGFAYALLQLDSDFGLGSGNKIYTLDNWKQFQGLLANSLHASPQEKIKKAEMIIPHLKSITKLYHNFRVEVTSNPNYRPLLEGHRSYEKYSQTGATSEQLSQEEQKVVNNMGMGTVVPGLTISLNGTDFISVPLFALTNKEAYFNWIKKQKDSRSVSNLDAINIFNKQIAPFVNKF